MFKAFLAFSESFGTMMSRLFLTLLYYVFLGPFALLYQLFADPLRIKRPAKSNWRGWAAENETINAARRQG
jgi:hypothetical protein